MKYLYLFVLFFSGITLQAQNEFITTWQVTSSDLSITIPTNGSGYNYTVNFGDGTILNNQQGDVSHTYNQNGIYTVSISGNFPRINFQGVANSKKIMSIEQWGNIQWQSMQAAFNGCINLVINATDAPDLSQVTDMSGMFSLCTSLNQPINHWDVSNVSTMFSIFFNAQDFNQDLSSWNFHPDVNFHEMFYSSGLDVDNYDKLLAHLTTFGYTNKTMIAKNLKYCDITSRDFLTNKLNWSITNDELAQNCNVSAEESILDTFTPTPNPTMGMIYLDLQNIHIEEIMLYNTIGQRIKTFPYVDKIDISEFHSGLYFLQLRTQETQKTYPIVKN